MQMYVLEYVTLYYFTFSPVMIRRCSLAAICKTLSHYIVSHDRTYHQHAKSVGSHSHACAAPYQTLFCLHPTSCHFLRHGLLEM